MSDYSKTIIVGRITKPIEMKFTPSGVAVANISVAVGREFSKEKVTDFFDVVLWRKDAEFANNYLGKGREVLVEGRMQARKWQAQDGTPRTSWELHADGIKALGKRPDGEGGGGGYQDGGGGYQGGGGGYAAQPQGGGYQDGGAQADQYDVSGVIDPFADQ
jgi:single-strand DNA-binding protein